MTVHPPATPAIVTGTVAHTRHRPLHHRMQQRHYQWLVDLDSVPTLPRGLRWLGRLEAADHLDGGRLGGGIRGDVERFLEHRGVILEATDRVLMLAGARVLGHAFDPLSVFWCLTPGGESRAVVFEVHNTYGERHAYLLEPDTRGRARVDKAFYVSPFNDSSGSYDVSLRLDVQRVDVAVGLEREGVRILTATTRGRVQRLTLGSVARTSALHPLMPQRVSALIRLHGVRLWLRRLPVLPRPAHDPEAVR